MLLVAIAAMALPGIAMAKMSTPAEMHAIYLHVVCGSGRSSCQVCQLTKPHPKFANADMCFTAPGRDGDQCRCKSTIGWQNGTLQTLK
jgi:hypothetical protein